jgi:zinc finger-like protein
MATPLIPQQLLDGGGGVAVLSNLVPSTSSNGGGGFNRSSLSESPILIFSFFQKAIRNELDALHRLALAFATGNRSDIQPLSERYHFLRSMYKHHSNAEDEVQSFRIYFSEIFVSFFG